MVALAVALLEHGDDGALAQSLILDVHHGVVDIGVEYVGGNLLHTQLRQRIGGGFQGHGNALAQRRLGILGGQSRGGALQRINDGKQTLDGVGGRVTVDGLLLLGGAAAEVIVLGQHPQVLVLLLGQSRLGGLQLLFGLGQLCLHLLELFLVGALDLALARCLSGGLLSGSLCLRRRLSSLGGLHLKILLVLVHVGCSFLYES